MMSSISRNVASRSQALYLYYIFIFIFAIYLYIYMWKVSLKKKLTFISKRSSPPNFLCGFDHKNFCRVVVVVVVLLLVSVCYFVSCEFSFKEWVGGFPLALEIVQQQGG